MSSQLKLMLEQIGQLSRNEQLILIAAIAQGLNQKYKESVDTISSTSPFPSQRPIVTSGDKSIDPEALFGIWEDTPRNLIDIRQKAWRQH